MLFAGWRGGFDFQGFGFKMWQALASAGGSRALNSETTYPVNKSD